MGSTVLGKMKRGTVKLVPLVLVAVDIAIAPSSRFGCSRRSNAAGPSC